jgi:glycosyltransferase involved in cell wall biosynthesis
MREYLMNRQPLFTIVTVTYNAADSLEATIRSVKQQTFGDYEYLIIDGGSTDGTKNIVSANRTSVSEWVSRKDRGLYDAMNRAVRMAKGEYIYFLNSGDSLADRNTLLNVAGVLKETDAGLIYGDIIATKQGRKVVKISRRISPLKLRLGRKLIHQSVFVRTALVKAVRGFSLKFPICADYDLLCKLSRANTKMQYVPVTVAVFDLSGISSNLRKTYAENYSVIAENFGLLWALLYRLTSLVRYALASLLTTLLPERKVDSLRRVGL